jgi:chemotaxis protein methyltransferase CheR
MPRPPTDLDLERVQKQLSVRAGIEPPAWVLRARVLDRMNALGVVDSAGYLEALKSADEEQALIELLRVGETRFFRHKSHVRALSDVVIPELRGFTTPVRAWSAGCATGEEAYTLALLLRHGLRAQRPIEILASDISKVALDAARAAEYPKQCVQQVPAPLRLDAFERCAADRVRVSENVRSLVRFEARNLAKRPYPRGFDIILCRNVLIYFGPEARAEAVKALVGSLRDGGYLFLGYSETLQGVEGLQSLRTEDGVVYRKGGVPKRAQRPSAPPKVELAATPAVLQPTPSKSGPAQVAAGPVVLKLLGEYQDSPRLAEEISEALQRARRQLTIDLDGVDFLDSNAAAVLRRAQTTASGMNIKVVLLADSPGARRFLQRHGLLKGANNE